MHRIFGANRSCRSQLLQELAEKILQQHFSAVKPPSLQWEFLPPLKSAVKHPVGPGMTKEIQATYWLPSVISGNFCWLLQYAPCNPCRCWPWRSDPSADTVAQTHAARLRQLCRTLCHHPRYLQRGTGVNHDAKTDLITIHSYLVQSESATVRGCLSGGFSITNFHARSHH